MAREKLTRTEAARVLDRVRMWVACRRTPEFIEAELLKSYGIEPLQPCDGEAHDNPHIDHCGRCAPRWGFVGKEVKVT